MLQALIFDSLYDRHRGVIAYIRLFSGNLKAGNNIYFLATHTKIECLEVGIFTPEMQKIDCLNNGEVGYIVTGLKELDKVKVGDTVSDKDDLSLILPGYKEVEPKVFASIFTTSQDEYPKLRDSIQKLKLNDASMVYEPENIPSLGFGFRCGFLGLLHLEITKERLEREFDLDLIITAPSVEYKILLKKDALKHDEISDFERFKQSLVKDLTIEDLKYVLGVDENN
jgi:GTP-binding protein LepA